MTFWDHLDELRGTLVRVLAVTLVASVAAFLFRDELFAVVFAPKECDFVSYRLFARLSAMLGGSVEPFDVRLINTGMAQQFVTHVKVAFCAGVLCASPYIVYKLFDFVSPALYEKEKKYASLVVFGGYVLFAVGVLLAYFVVFPLTFRFLGTYQVSTEVENMISLESYISTMLTLCMLMGILFELPVVCWLLAEFGVFDASWMSAHRKHAIVVSLVLSAVITPTADAFTLVVVALPVILLYEFSIFLVRRTVRR